MGCEARVQRSATSPPRSLFAARTGVPYTPGLCGRLRVAHRLSELSVSGEPRLPNLPSSEERSSGSQIFWTDENRTSKFYVSGGKEAR